MFKVFLFSICALLIQTNVGWSQDPFYALANYQLVGSVKNCKTTNTILAEKPEDQVVKTFNHTFNESGYLIEASFEIGPHGVTGSGKYVYNEKNQIVEILNTEGKPYATLKNTYDENGYITEERTFRSDGTLDELTTFIYNDKMECVLKEYRTDSEKNPDQIMAKYQLRYNAQSKVFEITADWTDFKDISKFSYNAKGLISEEHYSTTKPETDENQNYSLYKTYNDVGQIATIVRKDKEGKILRNESFVYDHLERLTHHNELNPLGKVIGYTQYGEFDESDNWIKSTTYEGKKIVSTEAREITYF